MEGKNVILSVLIMSLVMAQNQVEAKSCCPNTTARNTYNVCRLPGTPRPICASISGCKIVSGTCPPGYTNEILENSGDAVSEYCKLGCAFSVCGALSTLQNSDASEIVNRAVAQCTNACSNICTKRSVNAVEPA
ncbi:putative thionin-2.4 [Raphanus sativus]|uniref:Thionin-like n=1 Tax=Raphanus sativus TaxID=3726 RepID=A0A6J0LSH2_RAPSA|nr:thionin-like [Raphanus sativus]KAJ4882645.1 putative thionin-2.4 [Raphanus sativus]